MLKQTLYFSSGAYLRCRNEQLIVEYPPEDGRPPKSVPVEDIGMVVLEHSRLTLTHALMQKLLAHQVAILSCDERHMPTGIFMHLTGHTLQSARQQKQVGASKPLNKQLWTQTVRAKLENQAECMDRFGLASGGVRRLMKDITSGDAANAEGRAAAIYWAAMFEEEPDWTRDRYGQGPNKLLNYGYAILRAATARAIAISGLHPTLGIHHRNQYNSFCLADDLMEPYRPYVDRAVKDIWENEVDGEVGELSVALKLELLKILQLDVHFSQQRRPLQIALNYTAASLAAIYEGKRRTIIYPNMRYA